MSAARAAPRAAWGEGAIAKSAAIASAEFSHMRHDPYEILMRAAQPVLWLTVFGEAMSRLRAIPTGSYSYMQFLAPGILAQSVVFIAIFYGITLIWERDAGLTQKLLVTPTPRYALAAGKMLAAGVRALAQGIIVLLLALVMRIPLHTGLVALAGCTVAIVLAAAFFSGLSMTIACLVQTRERFMGMGQVITMPLFFASNALYPLQIMPAWLKVLSQINPMSYLVDALRSLLLAGSPVTSILPDLGVLAAVSVAVAASTAALYPRMGT
jgi:ABC-2 type transport system permease protein